LYGRNIPTVLNNIIFLFIKHYSADSNIAGDYDPSTLINFRGDNPKSLYGRSMRSIKSRLSSLGS